MVSTYTPNINLELPGRGDYVGTWDTPVNSNETISDLTLGGIATIGLNNSPVVLSAAQFQSAGLVFNSTLTGSVSITFPTSFKKPYWVQHACTGSSAFTITLQTTAASGQVIAVPPGQTVTMVNDGTNLRFVNFGGMIGSYWDYAGSSMPNWNDGCSVRPFLNCDGSAVSSATHPVLFGMLGGTLPDLRGRLRLTLDQSAARVSSAVSGFSPNTVGAGGGGQSQTIGSSNLPAHSHPVTDPGHTHTTNAQTGNTTTGGGGFPAGTNTGATINSAVTGLTVANSTYANAAFPIMPPVAVGGLTLIRAG